MLRSQGPPGGLPQPSLAPKTTPGTTTATDSDNGSAESGTATAGSSSSGTNNEPPPQVQHIDLTKPPGRFQLLFDEEAGFEYKSDKRLAAEARKEAKKNGAATTTASATAAATPAVVVSN